MSQFLLPLDPALPEITGTKQFKTYGRKPIVMPKMVFNKAKLGRAETFRNS